MIPFSGGRQLSNGRRTGLGSGFGGVIAYLMEGRKADLELGAAVADRVAWTGTRNLPVENPDHAARWMRAWANQNPRVREPVYHFGASLAPDEHLSQEQWELVAERMLKSLGLDDHQAFLALHRDRDHEHLHIAVNRVGPDLRAWKPSYDVFKQQDAARELEHELGLRVVPTLRDRLKQRLESNPARVERREIEKPFAQRVARASLTDFQQAGSWEELEARLARRGLRLELAKRGGGINVSDGHEHAGVARIDRTLSGPRLADRFGESLREYRARHPDRPALERAFERPDVTPRHLSPERRAENLVDHLATQRATWSETDLRRLSDRDPDTDAVLRAAFANEQVTFVGTDAQGRERFAHRDYLQAEGRMFSAATRLADRESFQLVPNQVGALLEERFAELSHEQRDAVTHATTRQDLALIVGRAGAGKTRLTRAAVRAWQEDGYRVRGAALAGKAAEGLAAEAGIKARTLASYELSWQQGRDLLTPRDVLLVDEAGMIDVPQMSRVLAHAQERGAKVVLVGDPDQLKAIGAGDAFRGLIAEHGAARVDTIRRQAEAWQRAASEKVAAGQIGPALDAYREHGAIEWHNDRESARDALVMRYFEDRYLAPDQSSLILAHRTADVRRLNDRIREARRGAGELNTGIRLNGREFSPGDRMLFLRNDHTGRNVRTLEGQGIGVKNGALGTLLEAEAGRFRIQLDSGRTVELNPRLYGRLDHGYATTVHKAQGVTVDRAYVLADRSFDRNLAYVALTRHRHQLALYVDHETFASGEQLQQVFAREPRKDLARDYSTLDGLPVLNPATEPARAGSAPSREPAFVEVTPQRLEPLQHALHDLERWDELDAKVKEVAQARHDLPYEGSRPDLEQALRSLDRSSQRLESDLAHFYRDPAAARLALEQKIRAGGPIEAFRQLESMPESYGRLHGRTFLGQPSQARAAALDQAQIAGARFARLESHRIEVVDAQRKAKTYNADIDTFYRERARLGKDRGRLLRTLREKATGLELAQLEGRLSAQHLAVLRDLVHLAPLRTALQNFRAARTNRTPREAVLRLAQNLVSVYRTTPRGLLMRLAPRQVKLIVTATTMVAVAVRKIAGETPDRARRSLRP